MPLLATNQRRPNSPIELGANRERVYFFKPSNPADPGSVHVCDVPDDDYDLLVKVEGYFPFRGTITAAASRPAPPPPNPDPPPKTAEELAAEQGAAGAAQAAADAARAAADAAGGAGTVPPATDPAASTSETTGSGPAADADKGDEQTPAEIEEAALNLLELRWQRIQAEIEKGGIPNAVAQRALDIELAKPEADQKLTVIKKLRGALGVE